ncbi:glycosyltransferase family 4 protein [Ancylobacter radicis]|uniref:Glycosyltransferase family 4 protein n=1 Tax=Ancylobacter radicis TaxID=2836179 RepID=A0ABS5R5U5_9HYPH|nr:glycosyltransferase family 4 protein [Ancylobacter radicis]MBS9477024.1 glycosyltransferase family 4 protein [Ancylobacter radicis]
MRCLFLAPLKSPDHPVPSGDRTMARLFLKLLRRLGYETALASHLRSFHTDPAAVDWAALEQEAAQEVERILAATDPAAVACVFTYHVYYKAPDLIGPALAARLGVPYVIAEASRAPKRASGPFAPGHARAEAAINAAALILALTGADREVLDRLRPPHQRVADLKPFLDLADWPQAGASPKPRGDGPARLVTLAMMRPGDKLASYGQLAQALTNLEADWALDIIGDGPARPEVEAAFAPLGDRVRFHGAISDRAALGALFHASDLFVWPGVNEAFGAAYLEAQAHGLPCLAASYGGIADAMIPGETGLLTPAGDIPALRAALAGLIADPARRHAMGAAAARFIAAERDLPAAATTLAAAFRACDIPLPQDRA